MAEVTTLERSTYASITDDILHDIGLEDLTSSLSLEAIQKWILDAEQRITMRLRVRDQRVLRLLKDQEDYSFADTKDVSGTGTITTSGKTVTGVSTLFTTELIPSGTITVSGQTKTIASIASATSLTVTVAFSPDIGTGTAFTFTPRSTELPTRFYQITDIDRVESGYNLKTLIRTMEWLLELRQNDGTTGSYTSLETPWVAAVGLDLNNRLLRVYPKPDADKDVTVYAVIRTNPITRIGDALTDAIELRGTYDPAIRMYVGAEIYGWLARKARADRAFFLGERREQLILFEGELQLLRANEVRPIRMRVEYT